MFQSQCRTVRPVLLDEPTFSTTDPHSLNRNILLQWIEATPTAHDTFCKGPGGLQIGASTFLSSRSLQSSWDTEDYQWLQQKAGQQDSIKV